VQLADKLASEGRSVSLVNVHTLKPLDREGIARALTGHDSVIVIEEHAPQGGLASQVKQIAWDEKATCTLRTYALKDEFIHLYGNHDELLAAHGIDVAAMASAAV
jgi:transketolase